MSIRNLLSESLAHLLRSIATHWPDEFNDIIMNSLNGVYEKLARVEESDPKSPRFAQISGAINSYSKEMFAVLRSMEENSKNVNSVLLTDMVIDFGDYIDFLSRVPFEDKKLMDDLEWLDDDSSIDFAE